MLPQAKVYFEKPELDRAKKAVLRDLRGLLTPEQVSPTLSDCFSYGRDSSSKAMLWVRHGQVRYPPDMIVWPKNTAEVSAVVAYANTHSIPLVPFGGGSGVCGGTWFLQGGLALDLKRMDRVLEIDAGRMRVRAQTGINGEILERALNRRGFTMGHFPSSIYAATLGGYLACRSAGQYSTLYGKIEDMVEGMEVVLADGRVVQVEGVRNRPRALDLKEVFLGSEGTMGVMTEAVLKLHPLPEAELFLGFSFRNMEKGLAAIREMMQRGLRPALVRLYDPLDTLVAASHKDREGNLSLDLLAQAFTPLFRAVKDFSLKAALKNPAAFKILTDFLPTRCLLILGFRGLHDLVSGEVQCAERICHSFQGHSLGEEPGRHWHKHRYSVSYKLSPIFDEGFFADTMEVATTWKNLLPLYHAVRDAIGSRVLVMAHFSHAYAEGCSIYFTFLGYGKDLGESETVYDAVWDAALRACVRAGGTISHHHGVGVLKAAYMKEEWGAAFDWLCKLKKALDPNGILNPGKLGLV